MTRYRAAGLLALALAGCSTPPPAPHIAPPPPPKALPPPRITPAAPAVDWRDVPQTPGSWSYARDAAGSSATFTETGGSADFVLRCSMANRTVSLSRPGHAGALTLTTSYSAKGWPASPVILSSFDPVLDQIAFSRGRFTVDTAGAAQLILPAWAEPARVIEDCRG